MPNVEYCLHSCQTNLPNTCKSTLKDDGRSAWTFHFESYPSFQDSLPKVTEQRANAKTNMFQVLRSGQQINGMLKCFPFLKTCEFVL